MAESAKEYLSEKVSVKIEIDAIKEDRQKAFGSGSGIM